MLGHLEGGFGQGRATKGAQIDRQRDVLVRPLGPRLRPRQVQLVGVALAVVEAQGAGGKAAFARQGQHGGRIEPTAEQHHRLG